MVERENLIDDEILPPSDIICPEYRVLNHLRRGKFNT